MKIFISSRFFKAEDLALTKKIEKYFKDKGYEVISPRVQKFNTSEKDVEVKFTEIMDFTERMSKDVEVAFFMNDTYDYKDMGAVVEEAMFSSVKFRREILTLKPIEKVGEEFILDFIEGFALTSAGVSQSFFDAKSEEFKIIVTGKNITEEYFKEKKNPLLVIDENPMLPKGVQCFIDTSTFVAEKRDKLYNLIASFILDDETAHDTIETDNKIISAVINYRAKTRPVPVPDHEDDLPAPTSDKAPEPLKEKEPARKPKTEKPAKKN